MSADISMLREGGDVAGHQLSIADLSVSDPGRGTWSKAYRIVSSALPPIKLFEDVLDPEELDLAYAIEAMTNDRLADEVGVLARVPKEDRISGTGSSPILAAFTHIGAVSRFTNGDYGIYYCASSLAAAVAETSHHRAKFLAATEEGCMELTMRTYINEIVRPLHDIRTGFDELHNPDAESYPVAQAFAARVRQSGSWGLLYRSVRAPGHECAAIFRPKALTIPVQGPHLRYVWDGKAITDVLQVSALGE